MTRRDILQCVHEPFGDAYYYGPERLAERFAGDEKARNESGFNESTYQTIMDRINKENKEVRHITMLSRFLQLRVGSSIRHIFPACPFRMINPSPAQLVETFGSHP